MNPESTDRENNYTEVQIEVEPIDSSPTDTGSSFSLALTKLKVWYGSLPVPARVAVALVGIFFTFSALTAILKLVSAVLSVLVTGVIFVLLYRFASKPNPSR